MLIASEVNSVLTQFNINNKVRYALTDNASNMKKAFTAKFPVHIAPGADGDAAAGGGDDDVDLDWETRGDEEEIIEHLDLTMTDRLSCFAHTLQLVVGDGLKDAKCITAVISKVTSISTLLHHSGACKVFMFKCYLLFYLFLLSELESALETVVFFNVVCV